MSPRVPRGARRWSPAPTARPNGRAYCVLSFCTLSFKRYLQTRVTYTRGLSRCPPAPARSRPRGGPGRRGSRDAARRPARAPGPLIGVPGTDLPATRRVAVCARRRGLARVAARCEVAPVCTVARARHRTLDSSAESSTAAPPTSRSRAPATARARARAARPCIRRGRPKREAPRVVRSPDASAAERGACGASSSDTSSARVATPAATAELVDVVPCGSTWARTRSEPS